MMFWGQVPESGKIYAFNEGNYCAWDQGLQDYINSLKDGSNFHGKPYSARCPPPGYPTLLSGVVDLTGVRGETIRD